MSKENTKALKSVFDKSTIIIVLICLIVFAVVGGPLLANRIMQGRTNNTVSSGSIHANLVNATPAGEAMPAMIYNILPGETIYNTVSAKNTGSEPEYVRIKIVPKITDTDGTELSAEEVEFKCNIDRWSYKDGYYYYNEIIDPGAESVPLYREIYIGTGIGNEYKNATLTVNIEMDAVQSANNGRNVFEAEGWMQVISPENSAFE